MGARLETFNNSYSSSFNSLTFQSIKIDFKSNCRDNTIMLSRNIKMYAIKTSMTIERDYRCNIEYKNRNKQKADMFADTVQNICIDRLR